MDPQEVRCEGMDWIDLVQEGTLWPALVNMVIDLWVP
jgi:hypothetical protein